MEKQPPQIHFSPNRRIEMEVSQPGRDPVTAWFLSVPEDIPADFGDPYVLCNETQQDQVLQTLASRVPLPQTPSPSPTECRMPFRVHIGFAAQLNFDIMAITRPTHALICDINSSMLRYYHAFEECIRTSPDRKTFLTKILPEIPEMARPNFLGETERPTSWLSDEDKYSFIRSMYLTDRIRHRCLDASGKSLEELAKQKPSNMSVQTLYASNIFEWLEQSGFEAREQFIKNMSALMTRETSFIDARYLTSQRQGSGPPLRVNSVIPPYATEKHGHRRLF